MTNMLDVLNKEIARELLVNATPNISEQEIDVIWELCQGNPWDAPILHQLRLARHDIRWISSGW